MFWAARALHRCAQQVYGLTWKGWVAFVRRRRDGDRLFQLVFNEEFLVSASRQLALASSLPFVHTARHQLVINLQRGIPSKRESSARADYVPALCTHRPSLLPIE